MRMHRRKNDAFCTSGVRSIKSLLVPNCLNIKYEFYGFSSDLIQTIKVTVK